MRPTELEVADPDFIQIGTFARATLLTVKALRHYQDVGVLEPAWTDPATKYRYYRWEQLADAICISTLRNLGVPLERIRQQQRGGAALFDMLIGARTHLEQQISSAEQALALINSLRNNQQTPPGEPEVLTRHKRSTGRSQEPNTEVTQLITNLFSEA